MSIDPEKNIVCIRCGQVLPAGAMLCSKCGAWVPPPATSPTRVGADVPESGMPETGMPETGMLDTSEPVARSACQKCGRELQPNWAACPDCGFMVPVEDSTPEPERASPPPTNARQIRSGTGWITGLVILALVLGCGLVVALGFLFSTAQNLLLVEGELDRVAQTATAAQSEVQFHMDSQLATQSAAEAQLSDQQLALENQALAFSAASTQQAKTHEEALRAQEEKFQATLSAVLDEARQVVYGPEDGELIHKIDTFIETSWAGVNLLNPIIEARFYNPYDTSEGPWDYGFMFRHTNTNEQYRLIISSDGQWHLIVSRGEERPELASGPIANLDLTPAGSNLISLWVKDGTANLYVNDQWITALDVSEKIVTGDVAVCTGFYTGYEIEGKITRFEGFTVSEIP